MAKVPFRTRYATSRAIFRQSWGMLRSERDLWLFPLLATLCMLAFVVPFALWVALDGRGMFTALRHTLGPFAPLAFFLLAPLFYPFGVLASLCNAALCFAAHERMEGRPGTKREAWRRAVGQLGPIARFNLLAMLVSGVLAFVGQVLDKLRLVPFLGQAVQAVGAFAWAAASYFVIPVLVVERERSALGALRASVGLARGQWGKTTAGLVTVGLALMVPLMAFLLLVFPALMLLPLLFPHAALVSVMMAVAAVFLILMFAVSGLAGAAGALYQTALYRYARTGVVGGPYTQETLVDAWAPYRKE